MKYKLLIVMLVLAAIAAAETKRHFHIHTVSPESFMVRCDNGGDPTGRKDGETLLISCGK